MENISKMILCGDPSYGGAMYSCPSCGTLKFVPFRCKSRFCPTCGNKYSIVRTTAMSFKFVAVQNRHCVFTIAEELRPLNGFYVYAKPRKCVPSSVLKYIRRYLGHMLRQTPRDVKEKRV